MYRFQEETFRQKIAALSADEVNMACDILVAMHPAQYFNALARNYKSILNINEQVGAIFKEQYHERQRLIGNESQLVNLPQKAVPDEVLEDQLSKDPDELILLEPSVNDIDVENIKVPDFLNKGGFVK